jgi:hypothetical protein
VVVLEVGAGGNVTTIRQLSERLVEEAGEHGAGLMCLSLLEFIEAIWWY